MNLLEKLRPTLMIFARYGISALGVSIMMGMGFTPSDIGIVVGGLADAIVGGIIMAIPPIYAAIVRPSAKAMATAVEVDKSVPVDAPVVIRTPEGIPDIVVPVVAK